jgi:purine-binding chemotaxis protein CheW
MSRRAEAKQDPLLDATQEVLRRRAESLALEQVEQEDEERTGLLLFSLGEEWYGVRIAEVREIHGEYSITPIPCAPDYIVGVVNIRGEIVSVTDLRVMMGVRRPEATVGLQQAPVIVVSDSTVCTALVVDAIGDIVDIPEDAVEPPLAVSDRAQADYISGTVYSGGRLVALVNLSRVLAPVVSG